MSTVAYEIAERGALELAHGCRVRQRLNWPRLIWLPPLNALFGNGAWRAAQLPPELATAGLAASWELRRRPSAC